VNHLLDEIAAWMQREPAATIYLVVCAFLVLQCFVIFGR
jgi:hypothetical protein